MHLHKNYKKNNVNKRNGELKRKCFINLTTKTLAKINACVQFYYELRIF